MARILITGTAGMIGSHLLEMLAEQGEHDAIGTFHRPTIDISDIATRFDLEALDVCDSLAVRHSIATHRPQVIYHLAAQSLPTLSWLRPLETMEINIQGTVNVFEAIKHVREHGSSYDPMVVVACSSAQYGASLTEANAPVREDVAPLPMHPYGVSKVAQDLLAYQYWRNDSIRSIRARIFNCTGPRKRFDVISDFAARIARIMRGDQMDFSVGNIESRRAIIDVRDLVRALILLAELGEPGEAYNICSDTAHRIGDLIPMFEDLAGRRLISRADPGLFRPSDEKLIFGSNERLKHRTGWRQAIGIETTMKSVLDYEVARLDLRAIA
jgi:GDP-4-dehydro-6-deoxy-D-mannose reductase